MDGFAIDNGRVLRNKTLGYKCGLCYIGILVSVGKYLQDDGLMEVGIPWS